MYWQDAGIYLSAIKTLGVAYPPGFPLYVMGGWLWAQVIPWGSFAQKVQNSSKDFRVVIAAVAFFLASLGPILTIIGQLILLKAALAVIGTTFVGLAGPVLLAFGKILLIIGAIVLAVEGLRRAFGVTWEEIGSGALSAFQTIIGFSLETRFANWKNSLPLLIPSI